MLKTPFQVESLKAKVLEHKWLLIAPIVGCTLLAVAYSFVSGSKWSATQPIVVREELTGRQTVKPGRFDSLDQMKTVQETILEICKSPLVLENVLKEVGAPKGKSSAEYPTLKDIEDLQKHIAVAAPNGAEFGQTEILHLTVKNKSQARAVELVETLAEAIQSRYAELRSAKAASMEKETYLAVMLHQQQVDEITAELQKVEENVGVDLGELRSLTNPVGGSGTLQSTLADARSELRGALQELDSLKKQAETLRTARENPDQIISTSNELLIAQPSLKRLKDGLIDAQLNRASIMGTFSAVHPRAKAALEAENQVRGQLKDELGVALHGLKLQVEVSESEIVRLNDYISSVESRLENLSSVRAKYENVSDDLSRARRDLAVSKTSLIEARTMRQATESESQIVTLESPLVGSRPDGLGKVKTAGIGLFCGLAIGIGLFMFVTAPNVQAENRKVLINTLLDRSGKNRANVAEVTTDEATQPSSRPVDADATVARTNDLNRLIDELKEYEELIDSKLSHA